MKNNGKSSKPIIAAHSTNQNSNEPAPPDNEAQVRRASSENLRCLVLERISDGVLAFDRAMNHVYVDERAGELLGRESQTVVGKNFWEEYPEATGSPFADACQRAFETQTVVPFEGYFPPSDHWFAGCVYPSSDGLSVLLNSRVKGEEASQGKDGELSELPLQNPNPVMRFTKDGKLLFANPASASLLENWKLQTATGLPGELHQALPSVLESGSNKELEFKNAGRVYSALLVPMQAPGYVNLYFSDITERKQAQESVQALIHQAMTGITRTSLEGKLLFANQAFCDMLGYSQAELLGRSIWEISHPADIAKNRRLFERMAKDGEPYQLEKRLLRRNGTVLWVSVGTSPLRDSDGKIYAAVSVIVDITRRKRAEESLLDSARRTLYLSSLSDTLRPLSSPAQIELEAARTLGLYLKASRLAYARVDRDGTVTVRSSYTDGAAALTGTWNINQIVPIGLLNKFRSGRAVVVSGADPASLYGESPAASKEPASLPSQIVVPLIREGQVVAALLVQQSQAREWTSEEIHLVEETAERMQAAIERARTERDLRESEKRFRILSNTVPSMVWSTAADGTVQYLNEHWYNYTGLGLEESVSNWAKLVLHPDDYEQYLASWQQTLATAPDEYLSEVRYRRYDGQYRWFQSRATPARDENGNVIAWYGVSTDIHDRVEREAELQQIINNTPFMFTHCSRDLRYQFVSEAYAKMIGRRPEEVAGKPIVEIMGEAGFHAIRPYMEQVLQGKRVEYEIEVPIQGVKTPFLHVTYVPDYDNQGNVIGWFASLIDLDERRQMENALRESERKFSLIYDHLPFVAMLSDPQTGLLVDVNETFEKVFGFSKAEIIGKAPRDVGIRGSEENREVVSTTLQISGSAHNFEIGLTTRDGSTRTFLVNIDTVEINGQMYRLSTLQDITERKQIENALRESEQKFSLIYDNLPFAAALSRPQDGVIVDVNREFENVFGYTKVDIIGKTSSELGINPDMESQASMLAEIQTQGAVRGHELQLFTKNKGVRHFLLNLDIVSINGEKYILQTTQDITERRRAEEALRASEEKYRRIVETANEGIWEIDKDTRTVFVNQHMADMLGYSIEEMMGRSSFDFMDPEDRTEGENRLERARSGVAARASEFRYRRKNGTYLWTIASTTLQLDEQGNFMGGVAMVSDITERKHFEKSLIEFARHQSALYGLADQLHRTNSLQEMYDASLDAIRKALLCDRASILLFDEGGMMRFVAWQGLSDEYRRATDGHSPWKPDEKNPVPIAIANIRTSDLSDSLKAVIQKEGIDSLAFIPILFQGRLIGKFMVYFNAPHIFSDSELNLSTTIARQLASVVDRKRNEYALRESQQRLALVYSNAAAGLVESSIDTRILECNDEFSKMTGYTREELLGRSFLDITDPEDRSTERELYQQLMTKQFPFYRIEKRYIKKDGSPTWCEVVRSVVLDENGEARFGLGAVFDSNERRQREEALRARTEEVEALMEVSPIGILVAHDAECMHITGNPAAYSILGFPMDSQENLSRSSLDTAVPSQSHRVFRDSTELAIHELPMQVSARLGMEIEDEELELRFEDGSRKYVYFFAKPLFDPYGRSRGSVAAMLEITERKQNEEALKAARRKAEETASRIARLQKVTAALSGPLNSSQVAEALATQGTTAFDAVSGTVMMLSEDGQTLETTYSMLQGPVIDPYLRFPITLDVPAAEAVRTGRVVWIESREFYLEHYPHLAEQINRWEYTAGMAVPLQYKGRISGVLVLSFDHEMPFHLEDQEFALTLARQGAQALERARAEEALRESEQRYRAIINQTTVGIVRKDPQGNLVFVNEAFSEMLGYTSSDLLGKSMWQLTHPDDAEENRRLYALMMKEGNPFEYEKRLIHHDGSIHWMMVSVSPLLDVQGRPESAVAVYADITLRKRFESELQRLNMELEARVQQRTAELQAAYESLRANEEKLRKVFEILPVGISFLGNEGQILEMNSALSNILGLSKRELMDGSFKPRRYIRPDGTTMPPSEFASTRALTEQKTIHDVETGVIKENGQIIWTSVNAAPVDVADVNVVIATIDITERKRAEDALHQNRERLKTLSRRLVEVQEEERQALARELHDRVGQNLAALNLNLNILRSQLSSEALQVIGTRLDDSVSLVNQILTITRNVMADLRSNVLDDYGLESALREYAEQFTQRTGVEVVSDKSGTTIPRLEPSIEMTLLRIAQEALTNVARHAQASKATVSIRSDDETVYMSIQDDGIGILSWQKANQPGSHGLRIIRERAEAFGGSLTVHSTYKKGTRIEVKIPLVNTNSQNVSRKRRS